MPALNFRGLGGLLLAPKQHHVPVEGGGGSAAAHELAPGPILGSSWQCRGLLTIALTQRSFLCCNRAFCARL